MHFNSPSLLPRVKPKDQRTETGRVEFVLGDHERAERSYRPEQAMMGTPEEAYSETLFRWPYRHYGKEKHSKDS